MPSERELREVAGIDGAAAQFARYREFATGSGGPARVRPTPGFREEFARARRCQAMWESGEFESIEALGRAEGITGSRVSQILYLLQLAPEIIDLLDVPVD